MKEINVNPRRYVKAIIEGNDIIEKSILDVIFDKPYISNKFHLGFVGDVPTMIEINENYMCIRKLHSYDPVEWGREIVKRLTGCAENNINICHTTQQYLEETMANPLIYTFSLGNDFLTVKLNYNVEIDVK